jgi:hypothetical protein
LAPPGLTGGAAGRGRGSRTTWRWCWKQSWRLPPTTGYRYGMDLRPSPHWRLEATRFSRDDNRVGRDWTDLGALVDLHIGYVPGDDIEMVLATNERTPGMNNELAIALMNRLRSIDPPGCLSEFVEHPLPLRMSWHPRKARSWLWMDSSAHR